MDLRILRVDVDLLPVLVEQGVLQPVAHLQGHHRPGEPNAAGEAVPVGAAQRPDPARIGVVEVEAVERLLRRDGDQGRWVERRHAVRGHAAVALALLTDLAGRARLAGEPGDEVVVVAVLDRRHPARVHALRRARPPRRALDVEVSVGCEEVPVERAERVGDVVGREVVDDPGEPPGRRLRRSLHGRHVEEASEVDAVAHRHLHVEPQAVVVSGAGVPEEALQCGRRVVRSGAPRRPRRGRQGEQAGECGKDAQSPHPFPPACGWAARYQVSACPGPAAACRGDHRRTSTTSCPRAATAACPAAVVARRRRRRGLGAAGTVWRDVRRGPRS